MVRVVLVIVGLGAACVSPGQIECGDSTVCPATFTCTSFGCASPEQVTACNGVGSDEECSIERGVGVCIEGACFVAVCGNGLVEPTEACDDGNATSGDGCNSKCTSTEECGNSITELDEECDSSETACNQTTCRFRRCGDGHVDVETNETCDDGNIIGGDGCSPDCKSLELCGNDTLDYFAGETCEDSNQRSRDGCSTTCEVEIGVWQEVRQDRVPPGLFQMGMAFDTDRRVWVMFGGSTILGSTLEVSDETWETDGTTWTQRLLDVSVPRLMNQMMAYDPVRKRVVMFGGVSLVLGGTILPDTWEYDGVRWIRVAPITSPAARQGASLVFDPKRKRLVMFGGSVLGGSQFSNETWTYDGQSWMQLTTNTPPPGRSGAMMAYDAKAGRMVVYGGSGQGAVLQDTWFLDGATWTSSNATIGPRQFSAMAYDAVAERVVMFSGSTASADIQDTQELIGSAWTPRTTTNTPSARDGHVLVADPVSGTLLLFGGLQGNPLIAIDETYRLTGTTFTRVLAPPTPIFDDTGAMAYDSRRGRIVLLTHNTAGNAAETWTFNGTTWALLPTTGTPGFHQDHSMTYDAERDRIVVFGGFGYNKTFELDGSTWITNDTVTKPPARQFAALAYDLVRKRVVMYGGLGRSDTWEYYGGDWHLVTTATTPPISSDSAMAFDASRGTLVLFGGQTLTGLSNETWEYDGIDWRQIVTAAAPPPRFQHAMVYDAGRGHLVVFGGEDEGSVSTNDTWELVGTTWRELSRVAAYPSPPTRFGHTMAYDAARRQTVVFSGTRTGTIPRPDTWTLKYLTTTPTESCITDGDLDGDTKGGCADDDCWGMCAPLCSPQSLASTCPTFARCGDATCDPVETCRSCPADCGFGTSACPTRCGDGYCDPSETLGSCPGDCTP